MERVLTFTGLWGIIKKHSSSLIIRLAISKVVVNCLVQAERSIKREREGKGVADSGFSEFMLVTLLSVCAAADLKEHRIPNAPLVIGIGAVLVFRIWMSWEQGGWQAALLTGVCFLARLVLAGMLGFPFWLLRMTGAGDVKMIAVIVAALGVGRGAGAVGIGLCLGAVLALGRMLHMGSVCQRFLYLIAYIRRVFHNRKLEAYYLPERDGAECVIPLGTCIWLGTLIAVLWTG